MAVESVPTTRPGVVRSWAEGTAPPPGSTGISVVLCTYQRAESVRRFLASLARQSRPADQLIVVDASRDADTEQVVRCQSGLPGRAYWRVTDPLRGLTRQRNFGLDEVTCDLVAFFDDDVVLEEGCLGEMERALRGDSGVVGVGCFAELPMPPTALWRVRHALGVVPHLQPGSYTRTGMSVPWRFHPPTPRTVDGDWLPGCAMLLDARTAARVRFDEHLNGYAQGEDLEFSLRLRRHGRLAIAGAARCRHDHAPAGRPDPFRLGEMEIRNRHRIWRRHWPRPGVSGRLRFGYAWTVDTLLLLRNALPPGNMGDGLRRIAGRVVGAASTLRGRSG